MTSSLEQTRVLVTGASGFLGEHLCRHLTARNYDVAGTYWSHRVDLPNMRCIPVDLTEGPLVERLIRDLRPEAVFHCAAMTSAAECEERPEAARASIVGATGNLLQALQTHNLEIPFLFLSTDLVFDGTEAPYSPDDPPKPLSVYGSLKWEAEKLVLGHPEGHVIRASLLSGTPASHRGGFLTWMITTLLNQEPLTLFEDEVRTPVDCRDVATALERLAANPEPGVWHAGGPERLSRLEMGRILCGELGFDASLLRPARLADSEYAAPRPADVSLDSTEVWKRTGVSPRSFRKTIQDIAAKA